MELGVQARRETLYCGARQMQREDHVMINLQRGLEMGQSSTHGTSETHAEFTRHQVTRPLQSSWNPSEQNTTHLQFGSESGPTVSTVKADYTSKPIPQWKQCVPEGLYDIHLADMAPRYMADKRFGKSLYTSDFNGEKSYRTWRSAMAREGRKVGRRHKTTQYQKGTHFELGSDPLSLVSDTTRCFTAHPTPHTAPPLPPYTVGRSSSNVFRPGDYNASIHMTATSTQHQDYHPRTPAGVSTTTSRGYSHVFPRCPSRQALCALRRLLIERTEEEFRNPRDPATINVMRAFLRFDRDRSGSISVEELGRVCEELGTPISEEEVTELLRECDRNQDGKIDYLEFISYLTAHTEPQKVQKEFFSTNTETFSPRPQTAEQPSEEDAFMGAQYQTSTHFQLGNHKDLPTSIYSKDFRVVNAKTVQKAPHAPPPPSSKVMHELPEISPSTTTSRKDFVIHDVASREKERLGALLTNRRRLERLAVVLSCGNEGNRDHYRASIMGSSYVSPPARVRPALPVNPVPKDYHHLESNRALPHPPSGPAATEAQSSYGAAMRGEGMWRVRAALGSRIRDNKQTHFILGFHPTPLLSEKAAEFGQKAPVEASLPVAGKPSGPTQGYSVIGHEEGEELRSTERGGLQTLLQRRNFLRNVNPRDPLNVNLRKAFLDYDKDLSGTVSCEEVRTVCRAIGVPVQERELEELITRCDKNGDGQIDYHEFALHLSRRQPSSSTPHLSTTTRNDFKHPTKQRLTEMQRLVLEQDARRYTPLQPTHFFHLDSTEDYLESTTRKDFTSPKVF